MEGRRGGEAEAERGEGEGEGDCKKVEPRERSNGNVGGSSSNVTRKSNRNAQPQRTTGMRGSMFAGAARELTGIGSGCIRGNASLRTRCRW